MMPLLFLICREGGTGTWRSLYASSNMQQSIQALSTPTRTDTVPVPPGDGMCEPPGRRPGRQQCGDYWWMMFKANPLLHVRGARRWQKSGCAHVYVAHNLVGRRTSMLGQIDPCVPCTREMAVLHVCQQGRFSVPSGSNQPRNR